MIRKRKREEIGRKKKKFFLVNRLENNIKTEQAGQKLQTGHRGQCRGYKPIVRPTTKMTTFKKTRTPLIKLCRIA